MKIIKNSWLISFAVLIILLAIVLIKSADLKNKETSFLFTKNIDSFCLNKICLEKKNNLWMVNADSKIIPANDYLVNTYIEKFKQIKLNDLISENKDKFKDFGIDADNKLVLKIDDKKLEIGSVSNSRDETYVKEEDKNSVYKIPFVLDKNNLSQVSDWEKKDLTNLPQFQITKVTAKWGNKNKEFVPKDNNWGNPKQIDKIAHLEIGKYLEDFKPDNLQKYEFEIETENGKTKLVVGKYFATLDEKYYFEISQENFNLLTGGLN
jgi:hypothetical protein